MDRGQVREKKSWLIAVVTLLSGVAVCQRNGDWMEEVHPKLTTWQCTIKDGCKAKDTSVVLDQKFRYLHVRGAPTSCKTSADLVNDTYCIDSENCYNNCVYEGANYTEAGVTTANSGGLGSSVTLKIITGKERFVNPRAYLLDDTGMQYEKVFLGPGTEFTYDVDMSLAPCAVQSAIYLDQMDWDGGKNPYFEGGASMGGGYCDGQCKVKDFNNGIVNVNGSGACCAELDLYEGNGNWFSFASHPCKYDGFFYSCNGVDCNHTTDGGICSKRDCAYYNKERLDDSYWGVGKTINTARNLTVITQFLTQEDYGKVIAPGRQNSSNADTDLVTMRRYFLQGKKLYTHGVYGGKQSWMEVTDKICKTNGMALAGGMAASGRYMKRGMVLAFSFFRGTSAKYWLHDLEAYTSCGSKATSVTAAMVESHRKTAVTFSNIRWGELGSTFKTDGSSWL